MTYYLNEIGQIDLLSKEEEIELATQIKAGDKKAYEKLVNSNLKLVISIAKKYRNRGMLFEDIIQEGNLGLMKAAEKFDPSLGFRFSTYASWWIHQAIARALGDKARAIRIPIHMLSEISDYRKCVMAMEQRLNRAPTDGEVALEMGITTDRIEKIRSAAVNTVSIEAPVTEDAEKKLADCIEDETFGTPEELVCNKMIKEQLMEVLNSLTEKEQNIIRMRFGLDTGYVLTLEEVGSIYGVTRERVRQIESRALLKLKNQYKNASYEECIG